MVLCWCVFQLVWLAAPASMYVHTYLAERRVNGGSPVTLIGRIRLNIVPHLRYKEEGQVRGDVEGVQYNTVSDTYCKVLNECSTYTY